MQNAFKLHIEQHFEQLLTECFLVACSGGIDSVVLTYLCKQLGLDFAIAHCNFQLRAEASDADENFVMNLAKDLEVKFFVKHFKTKDYIKKNKVSVQDGARRLRYAWFSELVLQNGYAFVLTAHHADDALETFLINLSRGTGILGLRGIPEQNGQVIRPLLAFSREEIEAYAKNEGLLWREDSSNTDTKYLRNKIRHELVPTLKELHPTFLDNFMTTQHHLAGTEALVQNHLADLKRRLFISAGPVTRISTEQLKQLKPLEPYLHGLFQEFGFTAWTDLKNLLSAGSGKEIRSGTHRLVKDRDVLLLSALAEQDTEVYQIPAGAERVHDPLSLSFREVEKIGDTSQKILYVDKETLNKQLIVRKWQKGDYFYPFGMNGSKKVAKFFKDEKIDILAKESQWLLCSGNDIVWVIGRRADDRYRVRKDTKKILKVQLEE